MFDPNVPALVLAPMEGITDAPMRAFQGRFGAFTYAVSEFIRVSGEPLSAKAFLRDVPELADGARTPTGLPVQVQILGGDPERMGLSARAAVEAGATAVDINFGCPAPTVNRHDGGATLLKHPQRVREVVQAVVEAVDVPVSAKLRLGWDDVDEIDENAAMAAEGGASWITIHARTRMQAYLPPVYWGPIGRVRAALDIPVVANGDIWTLDDFRRCQDTTGCRHFMIGRSALASPRLSGQIARNLGLHPPLQEEPFKEVDWPSLLRAFVEFSTLDAKKGEGRTLSRLKQWLNLAGRYGDFAHFDAIKRTESIAELFEILPPAFPPAREQPTPTDRA